MRAVLALSAALAVCAPARAQAPPPDAEVERHATLGRRHFEHGRYQEAVGEFRRAYELRAEPDFLRDIATAYRQLGVVDRALFYYDRYLAARPAAPDREDIEDKMAELEQARAAAAAAALRPSFGHDVLIAPVDEPAPAREQRRPVWRRWWFWTAVGVVVAAGVVTGLALATGGGGAPPATDLGVKRFY